MGMNLIQTGRFNRLFQKLFSIKGGANVTEVGAEILPTILVRIGAEVRVFEGWGTFGQEVNNAAGGAGNVGQVRLRNPAGSNIIAVITKLTVSDNNAGTEAPVMFLGAQTADLGTLASLTAARFDPRGNPQPTCILSSKNNSALASYGLNKWSAGMLGNTTLDIIVCDGQEFPLLPGDAFDVSNGVANQALIVSIWWRERAMEESELK